MARPLRDGGVARAYVGAGVGFRSAAPNPNVDGITVNSTSLASTAGAYMTGTLIRIDGGFLL
jgi:hypothetical protein